MRLHFLLVGEFWPYPKWFGSAYRALPRSEEILPALEAALDASDFPTCEDALVTAYEALAGMHNATRLTEALDPKVRPFHSRPFRVLGCERFVEACRRAVHDEWLRALPLVGAIDQVLDSTDVLEQPRLARSLRSLYS